MGDFRIELNFVGGHGCDRQAKTGEAVVGCGRIGCPDCETRDFIRKLSLHGSSFKGGQFINWPGEASEVVDELKPSEHYGAGPRTVRIKGQF